MPLHSTWNQESLQLVHWALKQKESRSAWGNNNVWDVGVSKRLEPGQPNAREVESELGQRLSYSNFAKILQILTWKGMGS